MCYSKRTDREGMQAERLTILKESRLGRIAIVRNPVKRLLGKLQRSPVVDSNPGLDFWLLHFR